MGKSVLKWVAALLTGAATTVIAYITAHSGSGPDLGDPFLSGVIVGVLTKLMTWLTSMLPADDVRRVP